MKTESLARYSERSFTPDPWQRKVLDHKGNVTMRCGRQVGKSTVTAIKAGRFAIENPGTVTLVIAASQRQSSLLFEKIRGEIEYQEEQGNCEIAETPTQTRIVLSNGSKIYCHPAGRTGYLIRGFTIDLLIADEAAYINEEVWKSVIPMLAVSQKSRGFGWIILLSTPFGKGGYYYDTFHDASFLHIHVTSEQCSRIPKSFLLKEKKRLTKVEYAQEYLGEFVDEFNQFFPTEILKKCATFITWDSTTEYDNTRSYFLGVDIARYGEDETAYCIAEMDRHLNVRIVKALTTTRTSLTETVGRIKVLDDQFKFRNIYIDDQGIGSGVMDMLLEDKQTKRKAVGLNNARKSIDRFDRKGSLLKEDLYSNALMLMEQNKLEMISDLQLLKSLKGMTFNYTSDKRLKIFGKYSHLAEAFVRACWCIKEKSLKVYVA